MNMMWKGGDVRISTGGGFKVNLLKKGLEQFKDDKNLIIFFTDRYDKYYCLILKCQKQLIEFIHINGEFPDPFYWW